ICGPEGAPKNPDPSSPLTHPPEIKKKKDPAWPWLIPNSFSMVGSSGERMILAMKLMRKIIAKKTTGPNCGQKGAVFRVGVSLLKRSRFSAALFLPVTFDVSSAHKVKS